MVNLLTKFEVPSLTRYGDMKDVKNAQNGLVWVVRGHPRSSAMLPFDGAHTISYSSLIVYLVPFSTYGELFVKIHQLDLPHLHLAPPLGVTPFEFRKDFLVSEN